MPDGEPILNRMTRATADDLQRHIEEAGGNEVFCAGTLDGAGLLTAVRVLARGHAEAVPALFTMLELREVVLHNHPSGNLEPSDADLELAAMYSAHGHGVYIVDNETTRVYVVVEPCLPKRVERLDTRQLADAFSADSTLARHLEGFERPQQVKMTGAIAAAFNDNGVALIEAPTGVGKTMAYLLPAVQWALRNKERIVVSTRTINLQEQIVLHDLPLLRSCMQEEFTACLVKGRGNYVCLNNLDRASPRSPSSTRPTSPSRCAPSPRGRKPPPTAAPAISPSCRTGTSGKRSAARPTCAWAATAATSATAS